MFDQTKLNVENKSKSNPFAWRGQFTPQFIDYLLDIHSGPNLLVLDPFSGSGTVLLECLKRGIAAVGCEVNPSAYAMSKLIELSGAPSDEKRNLCQNLNSSMLLSEIDINKPIYDKRYSKSYRHAYSGFLHFAERLIKVHTNKKELVLLLNILFKMENLKSGSSLKSVVTHFVE